MKVTRLYTEIQTRNTTYAEVAKRAGVSTSTVSTLAAAKYTPTIETAQKIAHAIGWFEPIEKLFEVIEINAKEH